MALSSASAVRPTVRCAAAQLSVPQTIAMISASVETDPPTRTVKVETSATQDDILKVLDLAGYPATAK